MKRNSLSLFLFTVALSLQAVTRPAITFVTSKEVNDVIYLSVKANDVDQSSVWVDLNNNKRKDATDIAFTEGYNSKGYCVNSHKISIYGKITEFTCILEDISEIDVTNAKYLTVLDCSRNNITELNIDNNLALTKLFCSKNRLSSLDVSKLVALKYLKCTNMNLASLDVTNNTALSLLDCSSNNLSVLDISKNAQLQFLYVSNNKLSSLDFSNILVMYTLHCSSNMITSLDLSSFSNLDDLDCSSNKLKNLVLSSEHFLRLFNCSHNLLRVLNLTSVYIRHFNSFDATDNPYLTCIQISNSWQPANDWKKDSHANWSNKPCSTAPVDVVNTVEDVVNVWTSTHFIHLSNLQIGTKYLIMDISGKVILSQYATAENRDIKIAQGFYVLHVNDKVLKVIVK